LTGESLTGGNDKQRLIKTNEINYEDKITGKEKQSKKIPNNIILTAK
jgi:hypothetical protein